MPVHGRASFISRPDGNRSKAHPTCLFPRLSSYQEFLFVAEAWLGVRRNRETSTSMGSHDNRARQRRDASRRTRVLTPCAYYRYARLENLWCKSSADTSASWLLPAQQRRLVDHCTRYPLPKPTLHELRCPECIARHLSNAQSTPCPSRPLNYIWPEWLRGYVL